MCTRKNLPLEENYNMTIITNLKKKEQKHNDLIMSSRGIYVMPLFHLGMFKDTILMEQVPLGEVFLRP